MKSEFFKKMIPLSEYAESQNRKYFVRQCKRMVYKKNGQFTYEVDSNIQSYRFHSPDYLLKQILKPSYKSAKALELGNVVSHLPSTVLFHQYENMYLMETDKFTMGLIVTGNEFHYWETAVHQIQFAYRPNPERQFTIHNSDLVTPTVIPPNNQYIVLATKRNLLRFWKRSDLDTSMYVNVLTEPLDVDKLILPDADLSEFLEFNQTEGNENQKNEEEEVVFNENDDVKIEIEFIISKRKLSEMKSIKKRIRL